MISKKELNDIRVYLDNSQNPLFLFDDDPDGVCSYLLLKRINNRGKGIIVKSSPKIDSSFIKKVEEVVPDKIFVLDKPIVDQEFIDEANKPIIWLDHHPPLKRENIKYYNPRLEDDKDNRPTSYWCYQISNKDLWLAMLGCVADWFVPEFINEFNEKYPGLITEDKKEPGEIIFSTRFGKLIRYISFLLKGKTTDVKRNISILSKIESPYEIIDQTTSQGKFLYRYAEKIEKLYIKLLEKAKIEKCDGNLFIFTYPDTKMSFSADLSNELMYCFPDKVIKVGRVKKNEVILSIRANNKRDIDIPSKLEKALEGIDGYGGGHKFACGGNIAKEDFSRFVENLKKQL